MKEIRISVTDAEHNKLEQVKDGRTWREAVFEEFGVETDE
jgi:hypothetical protein